MAGQLQHDLLPRANHDELARQDFVHSLKLHLATRVAPGNKQVYERRAKPRFEQQAQRPPKDRHEVRHVMRDEPYYQTWSALQRTSQEMMWEAVDASVTRQLPELVERASRPAEPLGSLHLDPPWPSRPITRPSISTASPAAIIPTAARTMWPPGRSTTGPCTSTPCAASAR